MGRLGQSEAFTLDPLVLAQRINGASSLSQENPPATSIKHNFFFLQCLSSNRALMLLQILVQLFNVLKTYKIPLSHSD